MIRRFLVRLRASRPGFALALALVLGGALVPTEVALHADAGDDDGIGGTGVHRDSDGDGDRDGIGGTGVDGIGRGEIGWADENDGIGGTGVVGIITGLGSIIVNGIKVDVAPDATVRLNRNPVPVDQHGQVLAVGQLVELVADATGTGRYTTRYVQAVDAVVGPVESVNPARSEIVVLGQRVSGVTTPFNLGQWVRVAGLRHSLGYVVATRITPVVEQPSGFISGVVSDSDEASFRLGNIRIAAANASALVGRRVWVYGAAIANSAAAARAGKTEFKPSDVVVRASQPFTRTVRRLLVQGYPGARDGKLELPGWNIVLPASANKNQPVTLRVKVKTGGTVEIDRMAPSAPLPQPVSLIRPSHRLVTSGKPGVVSGAPGPQGPLGAPSSDPKEIGQVPGIDRTRFTAQQARRLRRLRRLQRARILGRSPDTMTPTPNIVVSPAPGDVSSGDAPVSPLRDAPSTTVSPAR